MNWFDAMDYCNILHENAYLAEVRTKPTQEFIVAYADTIADHGWWLGGTDFFGVSNFDDIIAISIHFSKERKQFPFILFVSFLGG